MLLAILRASRQHDPPNPEMFSRKALLLIVRRGEPANNPFHKT